MPHGDRHAVVLRRAVAADNRARRAVSVPFGWGDLVVMRRRLPRLAQLAEA